MLSLSDRPIEAPDDDQLDRLRLAEVVAELVVGPGRQHDGLVVGLGGRWGSGKTSLLNLVEHEVRQREGDTLVMRFNPWLFSDAEELVVRFCRELGAQLQESGESKVAEAGEKLKRLGRIVAPLDGLPVAGALFKLLATAGKVADAFDPPDERSALAVHGEVREALAGLGRRVLVVVDDIDRLTDAEIRELARVVKVVGDLPEVVYLLAYDRERVEAALGSGGHGDRRADGRAYLEKIVQVAHDVPDASPGAIRNMLEAGVLELLADDREAGRLRPAWPVLAGMLSTPRDVRRLLNVLPVTFGLLGEEVDVWDVVVLEALRLFDYDGWRELPALAGALCALPQSPAQDDVPGRQQRLQAFVNVSEPRARVRVQLLDLLFPVGAHSRLQTMSEEQFRRLRAAQQRWQDDSRVALRRHLQLYLTGARPDEGVPRAVVSEVMQALSNGRPLEPITAGLSSQQSVELLDALRERTDELMGAQLKHVADELLGMLARCGPKPADWDWAAAKGTLIGLLRGVVAGERDGAERTRRVQMALDAQSASGTLLLLEAFGRTASVGGRVARPPELDEATVKTVSGMVTKRAGELNAEQLAAEPLLADVFELLGHHPSRSVLLEDDGVLRALLAAVAKEQRAGSVEYMLPWTWLRSQLTAHLDKRVEAMRDDPEAVPDGHERAALRAAKRYVRGELKDVSSESDRGSTASRRLADVEVRAMRVAVAPESQPS